MGLDIVEVPDELHAMERGDGRAPPPAAKSEERPVSLIRQGGDKMLFTTPKRPLKLKLKLLEHVALHWDWQLGAQRCVPAAHVSASI